MVSEDNKNRPKDNQINKEATKKELPSLKRKKTSEEMSFEDAVRDRRKVETKNVVEQKLSRSDGKTKNLRPAKEILDSIKRKRPEQNEASEETVSNEQLSRKDAKRAKKEEKKQGKKKRKGRIRYIPVWLRVILVAALCFVAFIGGLMFGFGTLGEGENPRDVLNRELWDNILNYIQGE